MSLTPNQVRLVRQSFDELKKNPQRRSVEFYEAFFAKLPEARTMFREDIEGQGMRFLSTLSVIVDHLDLPDGMEGRLRELGQVHRMMGVQPEQFEPMGQALIDTLEGALGEAFTPEMRAAWDAGFIEIAALVIEKGGIE
jgi:nitric oxide dioxygenase